MGETELTASPEGGVFCGEPRRSPARADGPRPSSTTAGTPRGLPDELPTGRWRGAPRKDAMRTASRRTYVPSWRPSRPEDRQRGWPPRERRCGGVVSTKRSGSRLAGETTHSHHPDRVGCPVHDRRQQPLPSPLCEREYYRRRRYRSNHYL